MAARLVTDATTEPVTRSEFKEYVRLDSVSSNLASEYSIDPGTYSLGDGSTGNGKGIDVSAYYNKVHAFFHVGTCQANLTVTVHLEDSDDDSTYTDVSGATFTAATSTTDEQTYELTYTGGKKYLRAVYVSATPAPPQTIEMSVAFVMQELTTDLDNTIDSILIASRQWCEQFTRRAFITQAWKVTLDSWPDTIYLPRPPAINVSSIKYYDIDGNQQTLSTDVWDSDIQAEPGRVYRAYGQSWPSIQGKENAIEVNYTAGYGDAASDVPDAIKLAIMMRAANIFDAPEGTTIQVPGNLTTVENILWPYRVLDYNLTVQGP